MNIQTLDYKTLITGIVFFFGLSVQGQNMPRTYIAQKVTSQITVDGKANESVWKEAVWSTPFIDIEGVEKPKYQTNFKMIWDTENLYFYAELKEPHVWATLKQKDTIIFYNNDFEIFIDPDGDTHNYYEFEMNALNTVWDLFLSKPYRNNGTITDKWDIKNLKSAVDIQGTLNNATDIDQGWSVEIAIPWSFVTEPGGTPKIPENEFWRINFSRVNWSHDITAGQYSRKKDSSGKFLHENNWVWSPQGVVNMHEPEHWGYVYFTSDEVGTASEFNIPKNEHIKWYLYALYREYEGQKNKENKNFLVPKTFFDIQVVPQLATYKFGWTIWAESPFTGEILSVNNNGKFINHGATKN